MLKTELKNFYFKLLLIDLFKTEFIKLLSALKIFNIYSTFVQVLKPTKIHKNCKSYRMKKLKHLFILVLLTLSIQSLLYAQDDHTIKTIVIDPGHGGKDPGTIGKNGYEKDLVLDVALKVGEYIKQNIPDVNVIYTRKTDIFIELIRRAQIANENDADLFISIHANGVDNNAVFGTESFVMGLDKSEKNFEIVKKENAVILQEDNYQEAYGNFDPNSPEAYIIFSLYQNIHLKHSLRLSQLVQEQFTKRVGRKDRGVKQAPFYVLWKNESPSILIELGFVSNPEEGQFLFSEQGKDYLASAIYRAFKTFKIEMDGPLSNLKEQIAVEEENSNIKEEKEPIVADTLINNNNIIFKVQFLSSPQQIPLKSSNFKGLDPVEEFKSGKQYKYTFGSESDINQIKLIQSKVRTKYADAFIVAFKNGEKIDISKALKEIKN